MVNNFPFYKQETPFTCSLACLRMILEAIGKKFSEIELSKIVEFKPLKGFSPRMMEKLLEIANIDYEYHFDSSLQEIEKNVENKLYPVVLVNPSILYGISEEEHGHYIVIKDITEEKIIINDPDQEYGGENKEINLKRFGEAWESRHKLIFIIKGERG